MKLQVVSDLHLEFLRKEAKQYLEAFPVKATTLVIAGDLCNYKTLLDNLQILSDRLENIVYVLGNHEYYGGSRKAVMHMVDRARAKFPNVHILEDSCVELEGHKFVGCTLWFAHTSNDIMYESWISDFGLIKNLRLWVADTSARSERFLRENVDGKSIVVTHHVPTPRGIPERFRTSDLARFFLCDVTETIAFNMPPLWVFGHTHDAADFSLFRSRLVANPIGYPGEKNKSFKESFIVEV